MMVRERPEDVSSRAVREVDFEFVIKLDHCSRDTSTRLLPTHASVGHPSLNDAEAVFCDHRDIGACALDEGVERDDAPAPATTVSSAGLLSGRRAVASGGDVGRTLRAEQLDVLPVLRLAGREDSLEVGAVDGD